MDVSVVALEPVAEQDKATLANLLQLYRYDLSEVRGYELSEHGTFVYRFLDHYFTEPGRHAFFVRVDGRLAGFALVREVGGEHEVAEFFVARRHRRAKVGRRAALALFARLPGRWSLFHDDANEPAARFWEQVVADASGGTFEREPVTTSAGFVGQRYRFSVRPARGTSEPAEASSDPVAHGSPYIPLSAGLADPRAEAGAVFDRIADCYDRARPGYPAEATGELTRVCGLSGSSRVLEIGCGTGQLTRRLAMTGASILAVEPGASLAARARANLAAHPNVEVLVARFEDVDERPAAFDLVAAATSFHWVDPDLGYVKAAELLRPGGFLALLTNAHAAGGSHGDGRFAGAVRQLQRRLAPQIGDWTFPAAEEIARRANAGGDIAAVWARVERRLGEAPALSGLFAAPTVMTYPWLTTYDHDAFLAMLASQSSYALLEPEQRSALMEGIGRLVDDLLGGQVTKRYVTVLAMAKRL